MGGWLAGMFLAGGFVGFFARKVKDRARRTTGRGKAEPPPTRVFTDAHMFTDEGGASNAENDLEDDVDTSLTMNTAEIVDSIHSMDNYEIGDMDEGVSDDDL